MKGDWAAPHLLDYAPYEEIICVIGFKSLVEYWSGWHTGILSPRRILGLAFLVTWLPVKHSRILNGELVMLLRYFGNGCSRGQIKRVNHKEHRETGIQFSVDSVFSVVNGIYTFLWALLMFFIRQHIFPFDSID